MTIDVLPDAGARATALDCERSFIVQAPAGSGKTGLLTRRFLRLLSRVKRPEEILAMTFTRKAAAEMRTRIIGALAQASREELPEEAYEREVHEDAVAALAQDRRLGWRLLESPQRLQIMTVDALNSRLITAMPITARAARVRIVESEQQELLYRDAVEQLLDWLTDAGADGVATRQFLWHLDASTTAWRTHLLGMLKRREQWLPQVLHSRRQSPETLRANSEQALARMVLAEVERADRLFPAQHRAEFLALMGEAREHIAAANPEHELAAALPAHWPAPCADAIGFWRRVSQWCITAEDNFRKTVNVNLGFPPAGKQAKQRFCELLVALSDVDGLAEQLALVSKMPDPHYSDEQWSAIESLLRLLPNAAGELERLMAERGVADYPALAARAVAALGDSDAGTVTDLALHLDYRIQHILVDEMQDTSASQYRLLTALTAGWQPGDGRTLFCVGDPMQSIYRFRGADVGLFLLAREQGVGALYLEPLVLSTNFRSTVPIVEWVNDTFAQVMGEHSDRATDTVEYSPSEARPAAGSDGAVCWHIGIDEQAPQADDIVALIGELSQRHPQQTIGVLARSRTVLEAILAGLQRDGIPCQAVDMDRLTDLPEVIDLLSLTRALEHIGDRVAWLALLRSPMIGMSLQQIDQMLAAAEQQDCGSAPVLTILSQAALVAHLDQHTHALLQRFLQRYSIARQHSATRSLRDRVEQTWCALGGPALLDDAAAIDNAWHYLDALQKLERNGQLDALAALESQLDEQRVTRNAADARVFAMTIFKSKGLEFDHVILPELQRTTRNNSAPPLFLEVTEADAGTAVLFSTESPRAVAGKDPLHSLLWRREQTRYQNELDRLLYVACTRARCSLHLFAGLNTLQDGERLQKLRTDTLLSRFGQIALDEFEALSPPGIAPDGEDPAPVDTPEWIVPQRRQLRDAWRAPAVPRLMAADQRFSIAPSRSAIEFDWAGSSARHIGTVVHGWLHKLAGSEDPAAGLSSIRGLRQRSERLLTHLGVAPDALDDAVTRVLVALDQTVASERGRWLLSNRHPDSDAELALGALLDDRVVRVVIDRVLRDDDGILWIVDYKTSQHEGGEIEQFFANECERYRQQLLNYRTALLAHYAAMDRPAGDVRQALFFTNYGRFEVL